MKEIPIFTENEKKIVIPLLKAKEQGDYDAAVSFAKMVIDCCKRALAEYKEHPKSEEVTSVFPDDDEFWPETVADKILELEEQISANEKWLSGAQWLRGI